MKPLVVLLVLFACTKPMPPSTVTQPSAAAPATSSTSGPRVVLPNGFVFGVEVVADDDLRAQGLMYRDHLDAAAGMLFFFPEEGEYPFWMKNTRIPLDMIWIDRTRHVVAIHAQVPPCVTADCPSYPPNAMAQYVLEIAGGEAARHGLKVGDALQFVGTEHVVAH